MADSAPEFIRPHVLAHWVSILAAVLIGVIALATLTGPADLGTTAAVVSASLIRSGFWVVLWLLGSAGLGWGFVRALRVQADSLILPIGVAIHLGLAHGMGTLGLMGDLAGPLGGRLISWLPVVAGVLLCGIALHRAQSAVPSRLIASPPSPWIWLAIPAISVLITASLSPPGWLWSSEFAGYDVLSYHLALPRDWVEQGRIMTFETNVYSALPSFLESGWTQLALMMGAEAGTPGSTRDLVLAGDWAVASQLLHAALAISAARALPDAVRMPNEHARRLKPLVWVVIVSIPWLVVTGSLAYNELGVLMLGAAACHAATLPDADWKRGLLSGLLLAGAVGCKPTAMVLVGPCVALLLLGGLAWRRWPAAVFAGCVAGVILLAPWLTRNLLATANPVFPFATGLWGTGHWSSEQAARWAAGHSFDGTLIQRIQTAFWVSPSADPASPSVERFRGLLSPQWQGIWILALGAAVITWRRSKSARLITTGAALGLLAWISLTHVQSRFLIPLLVPAGLLLASVITLVQRASLGVVRAALITAILVNTGALAHQFLIKERDGNAMLALIGGQELFLGLTEPVDPRVDSLRSMSNRTLPEDAKVLLIGDAAPYSWLMQTISTTTWDRSPLATATQLSYAPDDWIDFLLQLEVTHVAIDRAEIARLRDAGRFDSAISDTVLTSFLNAVVERGGSITRKATGELVRLPEIMR